jgi:hypothetical protein
MYFKITINTFKDIEIYHKYIKILDIHTTSIYEIH